MQNLRTISLIARLNALCLAGGLFLAGAVTFAASNDNFADAEVLPTVDVSTGEVMLWGTAEGDSTDGTSEPGEPSHAGLPPGTSVWYKWTAPRSGEVIFHTTGSDFDTRLGAYAGANVANLTQLAANDGAWMGANSRYSFLSGVSTDGPAMIRFLVRAEQTYYIAVDGDGGLVKLNWAYKSSGVFHFTQQTYIASEDESYTRAADHASMARHDQPGLLVTITRSFGSSGKAVVYYEPVDGSAMALMDYYLEPGSVTFNEHEMSRTLFIPIFPSDPGVLEPTEELPDLGMFREFTINLVSAELAPGESYDVSPPMIADDLNSATVRILDADVDPVAVRNYDTNDPPVFSGPTNPVINIEKKHFRVREDEPYGFIRIALVRSGPLKESITAHYGINVTDNYSDTHRDNSFGLNPGSDYATPDPEDAGRRGIGPDFTPIYGTVTFPQNDGRAKYIDIPILDDNRPEMNEDLLLSVWGEKDGRNYLLGQINTARITIIYDFNDPAAGSVDINHNADYSLDTVPPLMPHPGTDAPVYDLLTEAGGRTVIVGDFTYYNNTPRNHIARINPNGMLDGSFDPQGGADNTIAAIIGTPEGNYVIGGAFSFYNGQQRNGIARLKPDGTLDTSFGVGTGTGPNGIVWALAAQADGKIIIGGSFESVNGTPMRNLARLESDGSLDLTFNPGTYAPEGVVNALAVLPSGQIIVGGEFSAASAPGNLMAFTTNGVPDFAYNTKLGAGASGPIYALAAQQGKVLVGGEFATINTIERTRMARIMEDGSLDAAFDTRVGADDTIYSIQVGQDNEIYVGGMFESFNSTRRVGFARLYPNGTVDTTFLDTAYNQFAGLPREYNNTAISPKGFVWASGVTSDGGVVIGGGFDKVGGGFGDSRIQPMDYASPYFDGRNRASIRDRNNFAKLVGGQTPGPGSIGLLYDNYSVSQQQGLLYVSLLRENGALGYAWANFVVQPGSAMPGSDFVYNQIPSVYRGTWAANGRMKSDGFYGTNTWMLDVFFTPTSWTLWGDSASWLPVTVISGTPGSRYAGFELTIPSGADHWYPGGENVPLYSALGRSKAPFTISDENQRRGTLGFAMSAFSVSEGTNAWVTVTRTDGASGSVSVRLATIPGGTAVANQDYYNTNRVLTFGPNVTSLSTVIRLIPNAQVQPVDRTIFLRLSEPNGGPTLGITNAVLSIVDDDFPSGYVNFSSPTYSTNEGSGGITMTATRTGGSTGSLKVYYRTQSGSAIEGLDYFGTTNFLQWANLDIAPKTITIPFVPNDAITGNRFFTNVFFAALVNNETNNIVISGATPRASVQIIEDDAFGFLQFSSPTYRVSERGGSATITVNRVAGIAQSVSVGYRTQDGTASSGGLLPNYVPVTGMLNFLPGEVAKSFEVPILHDGIQNPESFYFSVVLSNTVPSNLLGWPTVATVNIIDYEGFNYPPGGLDLTFNPDPGFNSDVHALAWQPDGKVLVGGEFTQANNITRNRLARLMPDGTLDQAFQSGLDGANGPVRAIMLQSDGRVVLGGGFTGVNGAARNRIARLTTDGNVDTSFGSGTSADGTVFTILETFSGTNRAILIGGAFNSINGQVRKSVARLKNSGALDETFAADLTIDGSVYAIAAYPTNTIQGGKILIGGAFTTVNGISRRGIARLHQDGRLDTSFDPGFGADDSIRAIALQADGKVLIGGAFSTYNHQPASRIARLTIDGLLDSSFLSGAGANDTVECIRVLPNNRIMVSGHFTLASGVTRGRITRLLSTGAIDPSINFAEGANGAVHTMLVQPDENVVLGGAFTSYAGVPRNCLARIFGGSTSGSGAFEFTAASYEVNEGTTNAWITLRRQGGTAGNIAVQVTSTAGTAVPNVNYLDVATNIVFPEGEVLKTAYIPILRDVQITPDLELYLSITSVQAPGTVGNQPNAVLTIHNTDNTVRFTADTYFRSEAAVDSAATIEILREGGLQLGATVEFRTTMQGTAVPFLNYEPVDTTVVFAPLQQIARVKVPLLRDPAAQGNKTVSMELRNGIGTLLSAPNEATLVIEDADEAAGFLRFASTNIVWSESAGSLTVTILRTNGQSGVVAVDYTTLPGTAQAGVTYHGVNGRLTFLDDELVKTFEVPIFKNTQMQGDTYFLLALTNTIGGAGIIQPSTIRVTVLDDDIALKFSSPSYTTLDKDGGVALTVTRQNGTNATTTVQYATTNVTAMFDTNYTATTGTLTFLPGETIKNFNIPIKRDPRITGMLSLGVNLFNATPPAQLVDPSAAVVVIIDTDSGFAFADYNRTVTNTFGTVITPVYSTFKSATNVVITVMRTNETPDTVSVNYLTTNGTAIAGTDYSPVSGTLVFSNGAQTVSFNVPILNNRIADADKSFEIVLTNPTTGLQVIPPGRAIVAITNDLAGIGFSSPAYSVRENGVTATITVVRSAYTNSAVSVQYDMEDGSGINGTHYVRQTDTLYFAPGETIKTFTVTVLDNTQLDVDHTVQLSLKNFSSNAVPETSGATLTILEDDGSFVLPAGMALVNDLNGTVDPNETVTVRLALRNASGMPTTNLVGTLMPGPGVSNPSGLGDYGVLEVKGQAVYREFTFTATGTNGQPIALVLQLTDGATSVSNAVFNLSIGNVSSAHTNSSRIVINEFGSASPYPSTINVSGIGVNVSRVSVTLTNFTHVWPEDVSMILVSPSGRRSYVMSRAGGSHAVTNVTLTFEDSAAAPLGQTNKLVNSTNKPSCYAQITPLFPAPAPVGPYATNFSVFNGENPNGAWSLYVYDGRSGLGGVISNGWTLRLSTDLPISADLGVSVVAAQPDAILTSNMTYTVTAMNYGPSVATNVLVTDFLPPGTKFDSIHMEPDADTIANTNAAGQILWSIRSLPVGGSKVMTVTFAANTTGAKTNIATISSATSDLNADNNTAYDVTTVLPPEADLSIAIVGSANPVGIGVPVTYMVTVANAGPAAAPGVTATYLLPPGVQFVEFVSPEPGDTIANGEVTLSFGLIDVGASRPRSIVVVPYLAGTNDNNVFCDRTLSDVPDPFKSDNEAGTKTVVIPLDFSAAISGPNIVISWDSRAEIHGIEATSSLDSPAWAPVPNLTMVTDSGRTTVTIPRTGEVMFYRPTAN